MADDSLPFTDRKVAIAIIPKFSAFLSFCGSSFIIQDILRSHFRNSCADVGSRSRSRRYVHPKTLKNSAFYRLMLALSLSDCLTSVAWFMTTWPIPKDENSLDNPSERVFGNVGNQHTCTAQAFFIQLGIMSPMYNALLACYYYMTIRFGWEEETFKRRIEYAGHIVVIGFGVGTSVVGLILELYNNSIVWCWIAPYPAGCVGDECLRGKNPSFYRWAFYYGPLWTCIFFLPLFMTLLVIYVWKLDKKMNKYTRDYHNNAQIKSTTESGANVVNMPERKQTSERLNAVVNQGCLYTGCFFLSWIFATIVRAMQLAGQSPPWAITFLFAVFTPAQGFLNLIVYIGPRMRQYFKKWKEGREQQTKSKGATRTVSGSSIRNKEDDAEKAIECEAGDEMADNEETHDKTGDDKCTRKCTSNLDSAIMSTVTNDEDRDKSSTVSTREVDQLRTATIDMATGAVQRI